jgi:hypothetical protein
MNGRGIAARVGITRIFTFIGGAYPMAYLYDGGSTRNSAQEYLVPRRVRPERLLPGTGRCLDTRGTDCWLIS